ncbi:hypothetical protein D9M68_802390 [compost metagenome]
MEPARGQVPTAEATSAKVRTAEPTPTKVPTAEATSAKTAAAKTTGEMIDENRSGSGRTTQTSFQNGNIECERSTFQLWRFQSDHDVTDVRAATSQHRHRCVWRVDGEVVLAFIPLHDELFGGYMSGGPHRSIGKDNRICRHASQNQFVTVDLSAIRVDDCK